MRKVRAHVVALTILFSAAPLFAQSYLQVDHPQATPVIPGTRGTQLSTIDGNRAAGFFYNGLTNQGSFFYDLTTGAFTPFDHPGRIEGMSGNNVVGYTVDASDPGLVHGYLYNGSSFTNIDYPGAASTHPQDVDASGAITGFYGSGSNVSGFLRSPTGAYSPLQYPGSIETRPLGIGNGIVVGEYQGPDDAFPRGFIYNGSSYQTVDYPGSTSTSLLDIKDGVILGSWANRDLIQSGQFLYDGKTFTDLHLSTPDGWTPSLLKFDGVHGAGILYTTLSAEHGLIANVPEPASALNLLWLLMLARARRRRRR